MHDKPIIIAECCQNHNGSYDTLLKMLDQAAEAGADYVKIQSIRSRHLTHRPRFDLGEVDSSGKVKTIKRPFAPELARLSKLDLNLDQEAQFVRACKKAGIKAMTTPFTRAVLPEIKDMGFDAIKVASYDCGSLPFLREIAALWQTVVVSTGATTDEEIAAASKVLMQARADFFMLHCVTIYPTPVAEMHLSRMNFLRMFAPRVGLSSHPLNADLGVKADMIALAMGADCIERHYTILPPQETKDGAVSITPTEVRELRKFIDLSPADRSQYVRELIPDWKQYLGRPTRELSDAEMLNRDYFRGRFASPIGTEWVYNWEDKAIK